MGQGAHFVSDHGEATAGRDGPQRGPGDMGA
jgi:hypothetical protein